METLGRARFVVAVLAAATSFAPAANSEDFSIPPYRENKAAIGSFLRPEQFDMALERFSRLSGEPFDRMNLDVSADGLIASGDPHDAKVFIAGLEEFALRAVQARLAELDVGDAILVSFFDPARLRFRGSIVGESSCGAVDVEFRFAMEEQETSGRRVSALVGNLLASEQPMKTDASGSRRCDEFGPPWVIYGGPLLKILADGSRAEMEAEARAQILHFVDFEIVPQILQSRKVASDKLRSWFKADN